MKTYLIFCWCIFISLKGLAQFYPAPSCIEYDNGALIICPPDSVPAYTGGLLGYNIMVNDVFLDFIPCTNPGDTVSYFFEPWPDPGTNTFCAKAVYQNWISEAACDTSFLYYGHYLPFAEYWDSQSFDTNHWTVDDNTWSISTEEGNPSPSVVFSGQPGWTNYSKTLVSYPFHGDTLLHGIIYLEFDLKLNSINSTGNEKLHIQAWDWSNQVWNDVTDPITNGNGGFDWTHQKINIASFVKKKVFKVRFMAEGINSCDISGWHIDNISLRRTCYAPQGLITEINPDNEIELYWESATCGSYLYPISHITYGLYTSIGTGGEEVFDVAARWSPGMLQGVNYIYSVDFVPCESDAAYAIRIWQGDTAGLVYEQPVEEFTLDEWNHVTLDSPQPVDNSQMLWIGYHIETNTGYPAGVDYGPAYDGWGNMMFWEGEWSTLLEINPELDYNWNIIGNAAPQHWYCGNRVYRSVNNGDYDLIADILMWGHYVDEEADPANLNCYLVTDIRSYDNDTCESGYSNESCTLPIGLSEGQKKDGILVYPNPSHGQFTIESTSNINRILVVDLTGRQIIEQLFSSKKISIPLGHLSPGAYLIKILTGDEWAVRKICIRE